MHQIVKISVYKMYESCERTTFYVRATTDDDMTKEVEAHCTGSIYTNGVGLSIEEARDRALIDAHTWAAFLGIEPEPYHDDEGKLIEPSISLETYTMQRQMRERKKQK